jgi:2-polyprenyl-6-methoxyphenol hydroxylase-like FAD-dependent oxidoreductase
MIATTRTASIVGAGIAGPVLAMFLQRAGLTPVVYEGRPAPDDEAGAFLNLAPNGAAVLRTLGVAEEVLGSGTPTTSIAFLNDRGKQLGENPEATTLIKRGLLNRALREQAARRGVAIEFGKRLKDIEITRQRTVIARFEDGSEAHADLLVGCDGIHSRTRQLILPDAPPPAYTGVIDSGRFTRGPALPPSEGVMRMTFGRRGFFGYQVALSGEVYWFENFAQPAVPDRAALEAIPDDEWRAALVERHRDDHPPIADIIGATEGRIGRWPIYDLPSLPTWRKGPVCLIGDAAHATSPHVGQGASMAMEDAIVLAKCLRDFPDVEDAFAAYERLRKARVEAVVAAARRMGNQKAPSNALTRGLRDLVLPFFLKQGVKSAQQVYAYRVDWDQRVA